MASGTAQDQLNAGDEIAGMTVVEIVEDHWRRGETVVFLVPTDEEEPTGQKWVVREKYLNEKGEELRCPECWGPLAEGYPVKLLEG